MKRMQHRTSVQPLWRGEEERRRGEAVGRWSPHSFKVLDSRLDLAVVFQVCCWQNTRIRAFPDLPPLFQRTETNVFTVAKEP